MNSNKKAAATKNLLRDRGCYNCRYSFLLNGCFLLGRKSKRPKIDCCDEWMSEDDLDSHREHSISLTDDAAINAFENDGIVIDLARIPYKKEITSIKIHVFKPRHKYYLQVPVLISDYVNAIKINMIGKAEIYYSNRKINK